MGTIAGVLGGTAATIAIIAGTIFLLVLGVGGCKNFNRSQARKDAENQVKITAIQIRNQEQRVQIERQKAQIRFIKSVGIRKSQDEIAKTLTPLYVAFEYVQAIQSSGAEKVYIPTNPATGLPIVPTEK